MIMSPTNHILIFSVYSYLIGRKFKQRFYSKSFYFKITLEGRGDTGKKCPREMFANENRLIIIICNVLTHGRTINIQKSDVLL